MVATKSKKVIKKRVTKKKATSQSEPGYTFTLVHGAESFVGTGETALGALQNLKKPLKIITKGFITISNGRSERKLMFMPVQLKRMFYPSAQPFLARRFTFGMK
jgi:hypothetical protein